MTGVLISTTELLILAFLGSTFLSLRIRPGVVRMQIIRTFAQRQVSALDIRRNLGFPDHPKVQRRWNTAAYIVRARDRDGRGWDASCVAHFRPILPYAHRSRFWYGEPRAIALALLLSPLG